MKSYNVWLFILAIIIGGCSTTEKANEVSSTYIPASQYKGFSCNELFAEAEKIRQSVPGLERDVDKAYSDDKIAEQVGWWLFAPALLFMDGNGPEHAQLALAKGQLEAIQSAAINAKCNN
jgi:hypothetical protein